VIFAKAQESTSSSQDITSGSGIAFEQTVKPCCVVGENTFYSLDSAVHSIANNTMLKIITPNVILDSKVSLINLENISIIGHKIPTVNCKSMGAISLSSCNNVTIRGIKWENCGSSNKSSYPGISFYNSSILNIQQCTFYSSMGQAVLFLEPSGNVCINNCKFIHNSQHKGHGAAMQLLSGAHTQTILVVDRCNFSYNGAAKSIVYIGGSDKGSYLYFHNLTFIGNEGVPIYLSQKQLHIEGNVLFKQNKAIAGGAIFSSISIIVFKSNSNVTFYNNSAVTDGGAVFINNSEIYFAENSFVSFVNNFAKSFGGALYSMNKSALVVDRNTTVTFINNKAGDHGGAMYLKNSNASFDVNLGVRFRKSGGELGETVFLSNNKKISPNGQTAIIFINNIATHGGAVYSTTYSNISFDGNTAVYYISNKASNRGGAVESIENCNIRFDGRSNMMFSKNVAVFGGAIYSRLNSNISFSGNTTVVYNSNVASRYGGAVETYKNCSIKFDGDSTVTFSDNRAQFGGAILFYSFSNLSFNGNSTVTYNRNKASELGGAVYTRQQSSITSDGNSKVTFSDNEAQLGGAVYSDYSEISFNKNTRVTYERNRGEYGAGVYLYLKSTIMFDGNSTVIYEGNKASDLGGAVNCFESCNINFEGGSHVRFSNNSAQHGGAICAKSNSKISFNGNTTVAYNSNKASLYGGAIICDDNCNATFDSHSTVIFYDNTAFSYGGAISSSNYSIISFDGNASVTYKGNEASKLGGAILSYKNSSITFDGSSNVMFNSNTAQFGGAVKSNRHSEMLFDGSTTVTYEGNKADKDGAAISSDDNSNITFDKDSTVVFTTNRAIAVGGAMSSSDYALVLFQGNTTVQFTNNRAREGGAINIYKSTINLAMSSLVRFDHNSADRSGGAIYLSDNFTMRFESKSDVTFHQNNATHFGGAIYGELKQTNHSKILSTTANVDFSNNTALEGDNIYVYLQASCDETCLNTSVEGLNVTHNYPPRHLALYNPASCVSSTNIMNYCDTYFVSSIMLGQNIKVNACVLSFNNKHAGGVNFLVTSGSQFYQLDGTRFVPIACSLFEGISIIGEKITDKTNFSMTITSYSNSEIEFNAKLIAELSPCHPGYHYDIDTQKCECYDNSGAVSCFESISTIKRGYWFGTVQGKTTVGVCPNNYCDFTCCETTNGFYHLSPIRTNQCSSHRSGAACGSCEEGYTLSFDSAKCISINQCTSGQTVLVIMLSLIYWLGMIIAVFLVTYYHVEIGYFYAITYYYSILDVLLNQNLYVSQGLFTAVSIISGVAKMTPQFLGQLCLVKNMSAIDQQVIHYVHPLAVTIIIGMICLSARMSYRFSQFVSRGIIRVICFLLLLSYTSVATTSLLLLRSLAFDEVDNIFTYLSPDIKYFHGRHLPYGITAILCVLMIVIGLPLLLLLEPFINHKINFTRFKPLLDQFQGCYKDKYRLFAAYYMICRLAIILIIIINSTNNNTTQVLLLVTTTLLALIQIIIRPYKHRALNIFDGIVLQIMILASVTSLFDSFGTRALSAIIILLTILPIITFAMMELIVYKKTINKILAYCKPKLVTKNNNEVHKTCDIGIVIDDTMRKNATIIDM